MSEALLNSPDAPQQSPNVDAIAQKIVKSGVTIGMDQPFGAGIMTSVSAAEAEIAPTSSFYTKEDPGPAEGPNAQASSLGSEVPFAANLMTSATEADAQIAPTSSFYTKEDPGPA